MFEYKYYDAIATFLIWFLEFSLLWLIDWETLLINSGIGLAGPLNHEDIGLILSVISLVVITAMGLGLFKIRKSKRELLARILYYTLVIFSGLLFQNLYDLYLRLGITVYV